MKKRGVSTIITVIVLILVVLSAFVLVWSLVKKFVKGGANQLGLDQFGVSLTTNPTNLSHDPVAVSVTRNAGWGNVSAIKIVFRNDTSSYTYMNDTKVPDVLETVIYYVPLAQIGFVPLSFDVYPVISTPSGTVTGMKAGGGGGGGGGTGTTTPTFTYYNDYDTDGYGNLTDFIEASSQPAGYVTNNTDCNDVNAAINPGATELCDGVDNDCDSITDEGCVSSIQLSGCGVLNETGKTYILTKNLAVNGSCLNITASSITLDLNGHKVEGDDTYPGYSYGIFTNQNFITIKNGTISNFSRAIYLVGSSNNLIIDSRIISNEAGVWLESGSNNNRLEKLKTNSNEGGFGYGIIVSDSSNNTIINSESNYNGYGLYMIFGADNQIISFNANNNSLNGLNIAASSRNYFTQINATSNRYGGIFCYGCSNNSFTKITISNSSIGGVWIELSSNNILEEMDINNNTYWGIYMRNSRNNKIMNSKIYSNGIALYEPSGGIIAYKSSDNTLENNIITGNTAYGIYFNVSSNITVTSNNVDYNNDSGIRLYGVNNSFIFNNTVNSNGNVGIFLSLSLNNTLMKNIANSNGIYGIYLYSTSNSNLTNNKACSNLNRDFFCYASSTGNFGTGNNFTRVLQCSSPTWPVSGVHYGSC
jgi:parallel beta-helix repeat protein